MACGSLKVLMGEDGNTPFFFRNPEQHRRDLDFMDAIRRCQEKKQGRQEPRDSAQILGPFTDGPDAVGFHRQEVCFGQE